MMHLNSVENSFIQKHVSISGITQKLGLNMNLCEAGWVVSDPLNRQLLMTPSQVPQEMGALEDKLRRVFLN
jgi:hypothetical protein